MVNHITFYEKALTATSDTPFQVETERGTVLSAINIHAYTNDLYYGTSAFQMAAIPANSVIWFDGVIDVADLWFKNFTPGSNGQVVIAGVIKR